MSASTSGGRLLLPHHNFDPQLHKCDTRVAKELAMEPGLVLNREKAMEDKEEAPKVPSSDPDLSDLVASAQPQLQREHQPPNISEMKPLTREAYGGGKYAAEEGQQGTRRRDPARPRASATQSADGPEEAKATKPSHPPPPSTGDRDLDITGQSYIQ
ncbi:unnamed protein product [Urochloa humidicola]